MPCLTIVHESSASGIILSGFWMFLAYSLLDTRVWFVMYYLRKKNITLKKGEIETLSIWIVSWIYVTIVIVHCIYTKSLSPVSIPIVFWFQELFVSNVPDIACNYHYWGCIRRREFSHSATVKHWHVFISIWIILYLCDWKKFKT